MRNSTVVKAIYNGNGVTRRWDIPFEYLDTSEIEVILTTVVDDVNVEEHIPANEYSVDTSSNEVIYPSDLSKSPVEEGKKVTIHRVTDLFQESDYTNQGALWPESVEASFDKVHQILQEHQEGISRSVKVDITGNDDPQQYFNEIIETAKLGLQKATEAIAAAENAAASEANAAASETSAANSAAAALASQQAAALSETHAATSETHAAASETTAVASANSAVASQQAAALSAESASASKLSAESSAGTAVANAAISTSAANTAQNAATTCSEVLPQVLGAASNVATKASAAAASATQAALSANAAETASQTAVNAADDAQDAADDATAAANAAAVSAGAAATSAGQAETANTEAKYYAKITMDKIAESAVGYPSQSGTLTYTGQEQTPTWDVFYEPQKLTITGDTSATNAGTYTITMTPKPTYYWWDDDTTTPKTQTWTIGRAAVTDIPSQSGVIVYDGTEQTPTWADYDPAKLTIGGDIAGTNAGTYTATFTPTANYKWADGTTTAKSVTWEISAATVTIPTVTDTSKTYNGGSQAPTVTGLDTQTVEVVDDATAINAGSYMITFRLKSASLIWSDETTSDKSFAWTIGPKAVTAPTVTGTSFTYDGTSQGPTIGSYDTDAILVSGTTEAVGAGNYSVIFSLVSATNYVWSDQTTEPKTVSWAITPATVAVPALSNKSKTYNGSAQSPTVSPYDSNLVEVTGTTTATNAGSYTVTFHLLNPNVTWADETTADKTDTWEIAKAAGSLTLSKNSVSLNTTTTSDTVTVTKLGDGAITAGSSDTSYATVSVSGDTVTITGVATGSATVTISVGEGTNYLAPTSQTVSVAVQFYPVPGRPLNDYTWNEISQVARDGRAAEFWDVGDCKEIVLNGHIGDGFTAENLKLCVFILEINRVKIYRNNNTNVTEPENNIIFGGFKNALQNGVYVGLYDSKHGQASREGKYFNLTHNLNTSLDQYEWTQTDLRYDILGGSSSRKSYATEETIANPPENTLLATLPEDFRRVLRLWTHVVSMPDGGDTYGKSKTTVDAVSLLSTVETNGRNQSYTFQVEDNTCFQMKYFINGNVGIPKKYDDSTQSLSHWYKSRATGDYGSTRRFCYYNSYSGEVTREPASTSSGLTPVFKV